MTAPTQSGQPRARAGRSQTDLNTGNVLPRPPRARLARSTPAQWLAEWVRENRGLCRICNAAAPTADPLHCPTGCDLQAAFGRGGWLVQASGSSAANGIARPATAPSLPVVRSLGDILSDPRITQPPTFIVPSLVEAGAVTLLSGAPKAGKSTYASQVAADFSRGRASLDGTPMHAGRVLWLAIDEPLRRLAQRFTTLDADEDLFRIVGRERLRITPENFAALIEQEDPALIVIDTLSQLASDNGVKPNDAESVAPFLKALVTTVQTREHCGALFLFHAPHHSARAAGSVQWAAICDATLVLRRPMARALKPGESPDDAPEEVGSEDGRRILEGVTRWNGEQRTQLSYRDGRYVIGTGAAPLIDRVRWVLTNTEPGAGKTSASAIARVLGVRDVSAGEAVRTLLDRGECAYAGEGGRRYLVAKGSMSLYAGSGREAAGGAGETVREEVRKGDGSTSSRTHTPVSDLGRRCDNASPPADPISLDDIARDGPPTDDDEYVPFDHFDPPLLNDAA